MLGSPCLGAPTCVSWLGMFEERARLPGKQFLAGVYGAGKEGSASFQ